MKAAIVTAPGKAPIYGSLDTPTAGPGQEFITVRAATLSNLTRNTLMGSGLGSVSSAALVRSIKEIFEAVQPAGLQVDAKAVPLSAAEQTWDKASGKLRVVFTIG